MEESDKIFEISSDNVEDKKLIESKTKNFFFFKNYGNCYGFFIRNEYPFLLLGPDCKSKY